jgi:hypothetical protein
MADHPRKKPIAVHGALAANLAIAVAKFVAAVVTGSSVMLSEAIHSGADSGNELLDMGELLTAVARIKREVRLAHPEVKHIFLESTSFRRAKQAS